MVGCLRYNDLSGAGIPTDGFFDFRRYLDGTPAQVGAAGIGAILRAYRGTHRLASGLFSVFFLWAHAHGTTHIYGAMNPDEKQAQGFYLNGWRPLGPAGYSEHECRPYIPILAELGQLPHRYQDFLDNNAAYPLRKGSIRQLHVAGETILSGIESSLESYTIARGRVGMRGSSRGGETVIVGELGQGDQFGDWTRFGFEGKPVELVALSEVDLAVKVGSGTAAEAGYPPTEPLRYVLNRTHLNEKGTDIGASDRCYVRAGYGDIPGFSSPREPGGLTLQELQALSLLFRCPGASVRDLARALPMRSATAVALVRRLADRGLLSDQPRRT
jgi:hypothetical protein